LGALSEKRKGRKKRERRCSAQQRPRMDWLYLARKRGSFSGFFSGGGGGGWEGGGGWGVGGFYWVGVGGGGGGGVFGVVGWWGGGLGFVFCVYTKKLTLPVAGTHRVCPAQRLEKGQKDRKLWKGLPQRIKTNPVDRFHGNLGQGGRWEKEILALQYVGVVEGITKEHG